MARPIRRIEIYLPLDYNDRRPIPESRYVSLQTGDPAPKQLNLIPSPRVVNYGEG
jgi:hypothetical protein